MVLLNIEQRRLLSDERFEHNVTDLSSNDTIGRKEALAVREQSSTDTKAEHNQLALKRNGIKLDIGELLLSLTQKSHD